MITDVRSLFPAQRVTQRVSAKHILYEEEGVLERERERERERETEREEIESARTSRRERKRERGAAWVQNESTLRLTLGYHRKMSVSVWHSRNNYGATKTS